MGAPIEGPTNKLPRSVAIRVTPAAAASMLEYATFVVSWAMMGLANKYELPIPIHGLVHVESRVSGMVGEE
jgi:hypothetical protein